MNCAVVLAGGSGKRLRASLRKNSAKTDKLWLPICSKPLIWHSVNTFANCEFIDRIVLVVGTNKTSYQNLIDEQKKTDKWSKVELLPEAGAERYLSVFAALRYLAKSLRDDEHFVYIHDGARPMLSNEMLEKCVHAMRQNAAVVLARRVTDSIKMFENGCLHALRREKLWAMQTPQAFRFELLYSSYQKLLSSGLVEVPSDDVAVLPTDQKIMPVENDSPNFKITNLSDYLLVKKLMENV